MANSWDFRTINEVVPIEDVLAMHGIYPVRGKYRLREDDDTPSASIHPQKKYGNTIHDFGYGNNFNPLTLTMYLQNVDMVEASRILGEAFHVPPKYTDKDYKEMANHMADFEWKMIGLYPDMASKNIDFDVEKYGLQKTMQFSERFRLTMSELRDKVVGEDAKNVEDIDKRWYEKILRSRAVPYVMEMRDEYFRRMDAAFRLGRAVNQNWELEKIFQLYEDEYETLAGKLKAAEAALKKAVDGTGVRFKPRWYSPLDDFELVARGEVSFEIGGCSLHDVSEAAYASKEKVFYCPVGLLEYSNLLRNGMAELQVAAKQKGEQVFLAFVASDASKINVLVKALRGKEAVFTTSQTDILQEQQVRSEGVKRADTVREQAVRSDVPQAQRVEGAAAGGVTVKEGNKT